MSGPNPQDVSMTELISLRQGCTEQTCPEHGPYNRELAKRRTTGLGGGSAFDRLSPDA